MFCMKCGTQLPDDAAFCYKCGNKVSIVQSGNNINTLDTINGRTKMTSAKCTNCGATVEVDANSKTATCPYCNGNFNINGTAVNGITQNVESLLGRAIEFYSYQDYDTAIKYFNRVLDLDYKNEVARKCLEAVKAMKTALSFANSFNYEAAIEAAEYSWSVNPLAEETKLYIKEFIEKCKKDIEEYVYFSDKIVSKNDGYIRYKLTKNYFIVKEGQEERKYEVNKINVSREDKYSNVVFLDDGEPYEEGNQNGERIVLPSEHRAGNLIYFIEHLKAGKLDVRGKWKGSNR